MMNSNKIHYDDIFVIVNDSSLRDECGGKAAHPFADAKMESRSLSFDVQVISLEDIILHDFCMEGFQFAVRLLWRVLKTRLS